MRVNDDLPGAGPRPASHDIPAAAGEPVPGQRSDHPAALSTSEPRRDGPLDETAAPPDPAPAASTAEHVPARAGTPELSGPQEPVGAEAPDGREAAGTPWRSRTAEPTGPQQPNGPHEPARADRLTEPVDTAEEVGAGDCPGRPAGEPSVDWARPRAGAGAWPAAPSGDRAGPERTAGAEASPGVHAEAMAAWSTDQPSDTEGPDGANEPDGADQLGETWRGGGGTVEPAAAQGPAAADEPAGTETPIPIIAAGGPNEAGEPIAPKPAAESEKPTGADESIGAEGVAGAPDVARADEAAGAVGPARDQDGSAPGETGGRPPATETPEFVDAVELAGGEAGEGAAPDLERPPDAGLALPDAAALAATDGADTGTRPDAVATDDQPEAPPPVSAGTASGPVAGGAATEPIGAGVNGLLAAAATTEPADQSPLDGGTVARRQHAPTLPSGADEAPLGEPDDRDVPDGRSAVPAVVGEAGGPDLDDPGRLRAAIEAVLLVVDTPTGAMLLAQVLGRPLDAVESALRSLRDEYDAQRRGIDLREVAGGWRLYTRQDFAPYVERFVLEGQQTRLTQAALETLAVVAYRQPITRSRVSAIRGVNVDAVMRTLLTRGLVEECGSDSDTGGGLYRTTQFFLERLGISSLEELPSLAPLLPDTSQLDDVALST